MKVVICGGGIMGICVAHFLNEHGVSSTVVERHHVACGASGKAGGFLAKDWCGDSPLKEFSAISFDLHQELSNKLNGAESYDYRRLEAYSVKLHSRNDLDPSDINWLDGGGIDHGSLHVIGTTDTIAQLHPKKFVETLTRFNTSNDVKVMEGQEICGINYNEDKTKIIGVVLTSGNTIDCDVVVITMGPWSGLASDWFDKIPSLYGQKAHSITVQPSHPIPAEAIFTEFGSFSPELYPRPDGEVYICGMAENPVVSKLLPMSDDVIATHGACNKIKEISDMVSSRIKEGHVTCSQACYLPLTHDGLPLIGKIQGISGLYIAAGHGCWGILNAPATGKALSDLILNSSSQIDVSPFDPSRF